jgi:hypothetical protein
MAARIDNLEGCIVGPRREAVERTVEFTQWRDGKVENWHERTLSIAPRLD